MKEMTLDATLDAIPMITDFIDGELEKLECGLKAQTQIDVAIDEIFSNIARYAYGQKTGKATVQFDFEPETRTVSIGFIDEGEPFNPLEKPDPDVSAPLEAREIGGLGIFLVKKTMDAVDYARKGNQNILVLKRII